MRGPRGASAPLSVAPMMEVTDRHFRYFLRQLTRKTLLYTEMIPARAAVMGNREKLLGFDPLERPLALQVGGDDLGELAVCARLAQEFGYDEVNLNVGCPSPRVQKGSFGACLMATPDHVARCVEVMRAGCELPVTVKHRIGIDDLDRYEDMRRFVEVVSAAGCDRFTVHARKAWLNGLSPKENRTVPPLRYDDVYRLKRELPHLQVEINGGILGLDEARAHLEQVDAVMIGRAAQDNPYLLAFADRDIFGDAHAEPVTRQAAVEATLPYLEAWLGRGVRLSVLLKGMLQLFAHTRGTRVWKRTLSDEAHKPGAGPEVVERALREVLGQQGDEGLGHGLGESPSA